MGSLIGPADHTREPLPVLVLTGFLGSGKTSLLNRLLTGASGHKVAAVVNDFGDVEVDASQVTDRVDSMISLASGCLCCEIDVDELTGALVDLAVPELGLDLVVIEASGLAEPAVLRRMVHEAPRDLIEHGGIIHVVDAENLEDSIERQPRVGAHIAEADFVVVNKCDLVPRGRFAELREIVRGYSPRVAVYPTVRGAVPTELLVGAGRAAGRDGLVGDQEGPAEGARCGHCGEDAHGGTCGHDHHHHLHDDYTAVTATPAGPLHPRRFLAAVSAPPAGVFRIKGMVTLQTSSRARRYEVAVVGQRLEVRPEHLSRVTTDDGLVLIGVDLPADADRFLDSAAVTDGEEVDPTAEFGLHPYLIADDEASDVEEWIYDEQRSAPMSATAAMLDDPEDPDAFDPAFTP